MKTHQFTLALVVLALLSTQSASCILGEEQGELDDTEVLDEEMSALRMDEDPAALSKCGPLLYYSQCVENCFPFAYGYCSATQTSAYYYCDLYNWAIHASGRRRANLIQHQAVYTDCSGRPPSCYSNCSL